MADLDVAALQADRRHLEQRTADLAAENERLKREFKRIENAEAVAAAAKAEAVAAITRSDALAAQLEALQNAHASLQDHVHELEADAAALAAIKGALGL